ncbi:hypothetical protein [uncultured Streptococcus sp.]|uniref:hypothetical protein n=1 Tax=uncultured Streptococcus sp. TaxID=83427 RepID=UPI00265ED5A5|nr:hypothetical protein [uncultured Streptococcus sp.]
METLKRLAFIIDEKVCFYIGKSTNIRERLLSSNGHIHLFFKESEKLVPSEIKYYLDQNYEILVEIEELITSIRTLAEHLIDFLWLK